MYHVWCMISDARLRKTCNTFEKCPARLVAYRSVHSFSESHMYSQGVFSHSSWQCRRCADQEVSYNGCDPSFFFFGATGVQGEGGSSSVNEKKWLLQNLNGVPHLLAMDQKLRLHKAQLHAPAVIGFSYSEMAKTFPSTPYYPPAASSCLIICSKSSPN